MQLIEPCCSQKHVAQLISSLGDDGTALFHGYGDLSLSELLPSIIFRYSEADILIACPWLPDDLTDILQRWLHKTWARIDGKGTIPVVSHLTLVSNFSEKKSPAASQWLTGNPFPERLTLRNVQQNDTSIIMPDVAFFGPINLTYGGHFIATATKNQLFISELREMYRCLHQ